MKDIDFDELDKAVTSLMGAVPKTDPVKTDDDVKTLVLNPSGPLPEAETAGATPSNPVASTSTPVTSSAPEQTLATPAPSLATRRAGRFMDVVHPSSDMTKSSMAVSRHGGTIEPPASAMTESEPELEPVVVPPTPIGSEPVLTTAHTAESVKPDVPAHALSDWPDPLDMQHAQTTESEGAQADESTAPAASDEMSQPTPASPVPAYDPFPATSPFLPDAKVEKRPLGGTPEPQADTDAIDQPAPEALPEAPAPEPSSPAASADTTVLPEELQSDLMAIESRQADSALEPTVVTPEVPASAPAPKPTVTTPTQTSISQQYKESPSTGDQSNGAIYDTGTYHQPLQHPAKKKPGWIWVVWVLVLLIIGAGGGAVAYLYLLK